MHKITHKITNHKQNVMYNKHGFFVYYICTVPTNTRYYVDVRVAIYNAYINAFSFFDERNTLHSTGNEKYITGLNIISGVNF